MTAQPINIGERNLKLMTMFELVLKLSLGSAFDEITKRFPTVKIFIWCNREHDVYEIIADDPEILSLAMEQMPKFSFIEHSSDSNKAHLIVKKCVCMKHNTVVKQIGDLDILHIFPAIIVRGWEYRRFIAFRHGDVEEFLKRLETGGWIFEILRKVPFDGFIASSLTLTADALFSDLTEKQIEALLTAHRHGYYTLPRKTDIQTIALREKVPRTTFQEHLKKAENKLVSSLVPYVQLFKHAPSEKRKSLSIK